MRRKFSFFVLVAAAAGAAGVVGMAGSRACASTIYNDTFARGTTAKPTALNGSTPAPTDTNNATWSVGAGIPADDNTIMTTNGSGAYVTSNSQSAVAVLGGLAPLTNVGLYTLSATLTPTAGSTTNWLSLGFGNTTATSSGNPELGNAWLLYRDNGGTQTFYGNTGTSNGENGGTALTKGEADTFTITLNSSTGAVGFSDTLGLVSRTGTLTSTQMGDINALMLGALSMTGSFKDAELTYSAIPEPASLGLMALGGLGILLVGKRRETA